MAEPAEEVSAAPAAIAAEAAPAVETPSPNVAEGAEPSVTEAAPAPASLDAGADQPKLETLIQPTLLDEFDATKKAEAAPKEEPKADEPKVEAKPEGEKPVEEKKPDAEAEKPADEVKEPVAEPAPLEAVDYFETVKIPETIKLDDATKGKFASALDDFRRDPKNTQGLIDLHNQAMTDYAKHVADEQQRIWNETRANWRKDAMADPILGGAGHNTAMSKVATARDAFVSTAEPGSAQYEADMVAWGEFTRVTGAGDHPIFLKFLHNASRFVREAAPPPPNPKPTKDANRAPGRRSLRDTYTHPSSSNPNS